MGSPWGIDLAIHRIISERSTTEPIYEGVFFICKTITQITDTHPLDMSYLFYIKNV